MDRMQLKAWRYFFILLITLWLCSCTFGGDESKPFEIFAGQSSLLKTPLRQGDEFGVTIYVTVVRPVHNVKMKAVIPKEVAVSNCFVETLSDVKEGYQQAQKLPVSNNNVYLWEQEDLSPYRSSFWFEELSWDRPVKGKKLSCLLTTVTDGVKWSAPIEASVEFDYAKDKDETGAIGSVESGHYVAKFVGTSDKWVEKRSGLNP